MVKMQTDSLERRVNILERSIFQAYEITSGHLAKITQDRKP